MNTETTEIAEIAKNLPPLQRAELIESLIESMQHSDKEIEALWAHEAEDRISAMDRGEITAEGAPQILTQFRLRQQ